MPDATPTTPVRKTVTVNIPTERAFQLFTEEIASWWPLATHSVGGEKSKGVSLGTSVGDELIEVLEDGTSSVWGTVLRCDPPKSIAMTWHAGRPAEQATLLEAHLHGQRGRHGRRAGPFRLRGLGGRRTERRRLQRRMGHRPRSVRLTRRRVGDRVFPRSVLRRQPLHELGVAQQMLVADVAVEHMLSGSCTELGDLIGACQELGEHLSEGR